VARTGRQAFCGVGFSNGGRGGLHQGRPQILRPNRPNLQAAKKPGGQPGRLGTLAAAAAVASAAA